MCFFKCDADVEEQGRDRGVAADVDHAESVGQLTFSGSHKKQPGDKNTSSTLQNVSTCGVDVSAHLDAAIMEELRPP